MPSQRERGGGRPALRDSSLRLPQALAWCARPEGKPGLATSAAKAGVPDRVIMTTTRHRSRTSLDRYVRAGKRWEQVAAASVGL
jgi:hypothetical protein